VLLRGRVLADLYSVLRQGVRVSDESYSLKKIEKLYMPVREGPVTHPGFALVSYEEWLETGRPSILRDIALNAFGQFLEASRGVLTGRGKE
jgi:uncharacterized protein